MKRLLVLLALTISTTAVAQDWRIIPNGKTSVVKMDSVFYATTDFPYNMVTSFNYDPFSLSYDSAKITFIRREGIEKEIWKRDGVRKFRRLQGFAFKTKAPGKSDLKIFITPEGETTKKTVFYATIETK
jgi:hypothetical protein